MRPLLCCLVFAFSLASQTLTLIPQGQGARNGQISITSSASGLLIEGKVDGPATLSPKDHVEVWIASEPVAKLPPIGWGNQFGETDLKSETDCPTDSCKAWFRKQLKYREQFKRLFVRQWQLMPSQTVESYAKPAADNIKAKLLAPAVNDGVRMSSAPNTFHITVPYSAFPPWPSLEVKEVWLMVDVFGPASFSTTAPHRKWGDPATFNHLTIDHPLQVQLSPCAYPLPQPDLFGNQQPTFVYPVPAATKVINQVVTVLNYTAGYQDDPTGPSPTEELRTVFSRSTTSGASVCGPNLAFSKGAVNVKTDQVISDQGFDTKVLADGWTLVKTGPRADYSPFGSGECGACARAQLKVYAISPEGKVDNALDIYEMVGNETEAADLDFTKDWNTANFYAEGDDGWTATAYCLKAHMYKACGQKKHVTPPNPPVVKELSN